MTKKEETASSRGRRSMGEHLKFLLSCNARDQTDAKNNYLKKVIIVFLTGEVEPKRDYKFHLFWHDNAL
jgi:hypothetical protein